MNESRPVEGCRIFFLVDRTVPLLSIAQFLERRGVAGELFSDLTEFLAAIGKSEPDFVAVSVNFQHPRLSELIERLSSSQIHVIVFAEKPDRRSLPLIRRHQKAHQLMGALTGPALILNMRRILRKDPRRDQPGFVIERLSPNRSEADSEQDRETFQELSTDVRGRGTGPTLLQKSTATRDSVWEKKQRFDRGSLQFFRREELAKGLIEKKTSPLQVQVRDEAFKELARWIEQGLSNTLSNSGEDLIRLPEITQRVAVVRVKDGQQSGYMLLTCGEGEHLLREGLLEDLINNLKGAKPSPDGPQWRSFRILDVNLSHVLQWSAAGAKADFLGKHLNSELLASFIASNQEIPKLVKTIEGHLNVPASLLKAGVELDFDTYIHLVLNNKILPYVPRGRSLNSKQMGKLLKLEGDPLLIKEGDLTLFENQFLREQILELGGVASSKKKAA